MPFACIWKAPFSTIQILDQISPGWPTAGRAITPDGATVVGAAMDTSGRWHMARWSTATLAITLLEDISGTDDCVAYAVSASGSVIMGGPSNYDFYNYQRNRWVYVWPLWRLTGGGSAGAPLPDGVGGTNVSNQQPAQTQGPVQPRCLSDDGAVSIGFGEVSDNTATKWVNGTLVTLPHLPGTLDAGAGAASCSSDGSVVIGLSGYASGGFSDACYWVGTTLRRLTPPSVALPTPYIPNLSPTLCNDDCSILWGWTVNSTTTAGGGQSACYWDNIGTLQGDGVHYGTPHVLPNLASISGSPPSTINWAATDSGVAIAVGQSVAPANVLHAAKWTGETITDLGVVGSDTYAESYAYGCNHDATIMCGASLDAYAGTLWPVRWDASNTLHVLPTIADPSDEYQGEAWGVSRNGAVIFGMTNFVSDETPEVVHTLTDAELVFNPTPAFVDFAVEGNRRRFVGPTGAPQFLGHHGDRPFTTTPAVYLSAKVHDPEAFARNDGTGGPFAIVRSGS